MERCTSFLVPFGSPLDLSFFPELHSTEVSHLVGLNVARDARIVVII